MNDFSILNLSLYTEFCALNKVKTDVLKLSHVIIWEWHFTTT